MSSTLDIDVHILDGGHAQELPDTLVVEAPLEIRLVTEQGVQPAAVTMRTPGADDELALGFLYAEGVIHEATDVTAVGHEPAPPGMQQEERVRVVLRKGLQPDLSPLARNVFVSSACGLCGKAGLEQLIRGHHPKIAEGPRVTPELLYSLPERLKKAQGLFRKTGGLHAAALFRVLGPGRVPSRKAELVQVREDVGRHNALDKLVGWALREGKLPLSGHILLLSGRASYELLQKAGAAGIPVVCAVSAPSTAAVSMARELGITLVGFLRERRCNVYAGSGRLS